MLHGSETWPLKKENEAALQLAEMRMVMKLQDRIPSKELRERLSRYYIKTGCDGMGMCCEKTMIW